MTDIESTEYRVRVTLGVCDSCAPSFECENDMVLTSVLDNIGYGQHNSEGKWKINRTLLLTCFNKKTNKEIARTTLTNLEYYEPHGNLMILEKLYELCTGRKSVIYNFGSNK